MSLAVWLLGGLHMTMLIPYWLSQLCGGMIGAGLAKVRPQGVSPGRAGAQGLSLPCQSWPGLWALGLGSSAEALQGFAVPSRGPAGLGAALQRCQVPSGRFPVLVPPALCPQGHSGSGTPIPSTTAPRALSPPRRLGGLPPPHREWCPERCPEPSPTSPPCQAPGPPFLRQTASLAPL